MKIDYRNWLITEIYILDPNKPDERERLLKYFWCSWYEHLKGLILNN